MPSKSAASRKNFDPYAILELQRGCTEAEIQKAYKKQCLKWHPDKNRDNQEQAQEKFLLAKDAFNLLFDKETRGEFDAAREKERVRDERQRERMAKADGDRKRFMEDLERREREFADRHKRPEDGERRPQSAAEKKREENRARDSFEEIRKQLEKEVNEEIRMQNERARAVRAEVAERPAPQLRVKWKRGEYSEDSLRKRFTQYGRIHAVTGVLVTKSGSRMCVVEYEKGENAWGAELEIGEPGEKFSAEWLTEPEKDLATASRRTMKEENDGDDSVNCIVPPGWASTFTLGPKYGNTM